MASRMRHSSVRQPTATPGPSQRTTQTAAYEPPQFPMNPAAQRALRDLQTKYSFGIVGKRYEEAEAAVTLCAGEINDRLKEKEIALTRRKKLASQAQDGDSVDFEADDASMAELKDKVERMTQRMDESMQKLIDGRHYLEGMKQSMVAITAEAVANASTQASTQNVRSQARRRRQAAGSDEEDEEEEYDEIDPTDPAGATQTVLSTSGAFASKLADTMLRHQNYSKRQRYASNNEYREYKSIVHNAQYPEEEVTLPHESEWFAEPGAQAHPGATGAEDDDDDDIQVQRAKTSTKCPLTLQEFKEPLTSSKCKHSFEASAILELLSSSAEREPGRGGAQFVRCPVPSCDARFTKIDLVKDTVLIHRIQRLQRAKRLQEQDAEDGDEGERGRRGVVIDDDDDGAADVDAFDSEIKPTQGVKAEQSTARSSRVPGTAPPRSTGVIDLGGSSGEEDEEDEDVEIEN